MMKCIVNIASAYNPSKQFTDAEMRSLRRIGFVFTDNFVMADPKQTTEIKITSIENLKAFIQEFGKIILDPNDKGAYNLIIYYDYFE